MGLNSLPPPTHPPHPLPLPRPQEFPWEGGREAQSQAAWVCTAKSTRLLSVWPRAGYQISLGLSVPVYVMGSDLYPPPQVMRMK